MTTGRNARIAYDDDTDTDRRLRAVVMSKLSESVRFGSVEYRVQSFVDQIRPSSKRRKVLLVVLETFDYL